MSRESSPERRSFLFCDRGSWHGYRWGARSLVDAIACDTGEMTSLFVSRAIVERRITDGRLRVRLEGGGKVELYFLDARSAALSVEGDAEITGLGGPFRLDRVDDGYYHHVYPDGPGGPGADLEGLPRTLRWNWREPLRDLRHGGVIPSPHAYNGLWAWDSWKHAAVLPRELARSQIQAMFDHQRADGMVPDTVMPEARRNNWRCTKPPLAAWACAQHEGFIDEFREPLERYHRWWEEHRRPPGEGLFAYGGDDLEASKWESGWDNATRYDGVQLRGGLQSVLSVDLNAYMCLEKRLLGRPDAELEGRVREVFFRDGAFHDVTWPKHDKVPTLTAATWIPLWCGVASDEQADAVIELMLDPRHFDTPLPFPTVAASDREFDADGYWRGPVWFDHAAWAVEVLVRHGRRDEARERGRRLLAADPDWECYHPFSGAPARGPRAAVPQFSWTAAARVWIERLLGELEESR